MSLFKLAVYGGIGYCIYQTFFAEMPASVETGGSRRSGSSRGGQRSQRSGEGSSGTKAMTGRGKGKGGISHDSDGAASRHSVGRGVV